MQTITSTQRIKSRYSTYIIFRTCTFERIQNIYYRFKTNLLSSEKHQFIINSGSSQHSTNIETQYSILTLFSQLGGSQKCVNYIHTITGLLGWAKRFPVNVTQFVLNLAHPLVQKPYDKKYDDKILICHHSQHHGKLEYTGFLFLSFRGLCHNCLLNIPVNTA